MFYHLPGARKNRVLEQIELTVGIANDRDVRYHLCRQVIAGLAAHRLGGAKIGLGLRDGGVERLVAENGNRRLAQHRLRDAHQVRSGAQIEIGHVLEFGKPYPLAAAANLIGEGDEFRVLLSPPGRPVPHRCIRH